MAKKSKKDAIVKAEKRQVIKAVPLKASAVNQEGMSGFETIQEALEAYSGAAVVAPAFLLSPNPMSDNDGEVALGSESSTPHASACSISGYGEVSRLNIPDVEENLALLGDEDNDYTPDDVDIPCDAARTAILNATRSIAEINFRRAVKQLSMASIYGATRGTIAKYFDALTKLSRDIESGIVAGEHEFLQGKIAEAQVKSNIVSGKLGPRATVIASIVGDRTRSFITNATNQQDTLARNAAMCTQVAMGNADNDQRILASYNNFLATLAQIDGQHDRAVGSIIAACVSQTGAPGISWIEVT